MAGKKWLCISYPSYPYIGTPANLAREAGWWLGPQRMDFSGFLRERYERARLSAAQIGAIQWLAAQPNGPAKILVISEEGSSDCRRDVSMLARPGGSWGVGGNPSLEGVKRQQGALHPGWSNGRVQCCQQYFLREERDLLERTALD